jgi:coenzyme F420-reducing hydrogenase alpha subunit
MFVASLPAHSKDFDSDKLFKDLEGQLDLASDRMDELEPQLRDVMDSKSKELNSSLEQAMDRSIIEIESMSKDLEKASEEAQKKLEQVLASEEIEKVKSFLAGIDKDAIEEARNSIVDHLTEILELTQDQISAITPVIKKDIEKRSELLKSYMNDLERDFDRFSEELEKLGKESARQFEELLSSDQLKKLEHEMKEIKERIRTEIFEKM